MHRHPLFRLAFWLSGTIAAIHIAGTELYLYWSYPWLDILVHYLGGLFVGTVALWFFFESGYLSLRRTKWVALLLLLGAIAFFGIGWEIFEIYVGVPVEEEYALDTTIDLVMDLLGALTGYGIFLYAYLRDRHAL